MAATYSSVFVIDVEETLNTGGTVSVVVANPGVAFKVLAVLATGVNTAALRVRKNSGAGDIVAGPTALAAGDLNDFPLSLTDANTSLLASDAIFLEATAGANITRAKLLCMAEGGGAALAVT